MNDFAKILLVHDIKTQLGIPKHLDKLLSFHQVQINKSNAQKTIKIDNIFLLSRKERSRRREKKNQKLIKYPHCLTSHIRL